MSVQNYLMAIRQFGNANQHSDYAALEARCAGLERERDALDLKYIKDSSGLEWDNAGLETKVQQITAERDALQAKLAAAEEALRVIAMQAALSDTAMNEVQP